MNIEQEVEKLQKSVEILSSIVAILARSVVDAVDEIDEEEVAVVFSPPEQPNGLSDKEIKLIADCLWEYLGADHVYNQQEFRFSALSMTGEAEVRNILYKIYETYSGIDWDEEDETNFVYGKLGE